MIYHKPILCNNSTFSPTVAISKYAQCISEPHKAIPVGTQTEFQCKLPVMLGKYWLNGFIMSLKKSIPLCENALQVTICTWSWYIICCCCCTTLSLLSLNTAQWGKVESYIFQWCAHLDVGLGGCSWTCKVWILVILFLYFAVCILASIIVDGFNGENLSFLMPHWCFSSVGFPVLRWGNPPILLTPACCQPAGRALPHTPVLRPILPWSLSQNQSVLALTSLVCWHLSQDIITLGTSFPMTSPPPLLEITSHPVSVQVFSELLGRWHEGFLSKSGWMLHWLGICAYCTSAKWAYNTHQHCLHMPVPWLGLLIRSSCLWASLRWLVGHHMNIMLD